MKKTLVAIMVGIMCSLFTVGCGQKAAPIADESDDLNKKLEELQEEDPKAEEITAEEDETLKKNKKKEINNEEIEVVEERQEVVSVDECNDMIDQLRKTEPVHPAEMEILAQMASLVTFSKVIDEEGVIFSEMDNYDRSALRRQIMDNIVWEESDFYQAITIEQSDGRYNADLLVPVEEAVAFFKEIYGEENFTPAEYEQIEDGYILISYGDGDPWHIVEHMQFFEDEEYFLLTGPAFYEDNGGNIDFLGYADILFRKNADSRYGVTLLYGRYRDRKIKISYVETSSELPSSGSRTYSGMNLIDDDYTTIWSEGVPGTGLGETITLHLDKEQPVFGVLICNGYETSYEQYINNGMLTDVDVDFGKGIYAKGHDLEGYGSEGYTAQNLADMNKSKVELDEPVITDTIIITITGAKKGERYDDTCVSEIRVY